VPEKIQRVALPHPVCLAGERRCPLEDVSGVHGYQEFLEVILEAWTIRTTRSMGRRALPRWVSPENC